MVDGINRTRDDKLIKMVIELAKTMNMTVVQEGVENKDMFNRIISMGIDVVQGYYYAKAISLEEYKIFLKSNTSIKYKSIVK
jgi:EAL domain-containing protein (putative c-di-GMP-specific phosphodiesterase class I)